jgi:thioesterase domain-containing protein/acyl carrier protein
LVAPHDETELELVRIWEEVLDVRPIGIRDSFFDLGGHSFLAVRLMGRIRQRFERDLPLSILFSRGTVEHLATFLRDREAPVFHPVLVPIQTAGSKPPFFCVHPVGGSVLCYADLARSLGPDQPFYGLQAPALNGGGAPSLGDLAQLYVRQLRQVEPKGPYRLGGWSMGGLVAFEMARQLQEQGEAVALVALIDAVLPGNGAYPASSDEASLTAWFARDFAALSGQTTEASDIEPAELRRLFAIFCANAQALLAYAPGAYAGRVALFQAGEELAGSGRHVELAWGSVAAQLEAHVVPGNHYTLVREPHVQTLAERLRSSLEEAQERMLTEVQS